MSVIFIFKVILNSQSPNNSTCLEDQFWVNAKVGRLSVGAGDHSFVVFG